MTIISKQIQKEFTRETLNLQLKRITMAIYAAMVLVPLFNILDLFVFPEQQMFFLKLRLLSVAFLGAGVFLIKSRENFVKRYLFEFTFVSTLVVSIPITIMIMFYGGHESPYYAGLILVIFCTSLLMPWSIVQGCIVFGTIYAGYLGSIVLFDDISNVSILLNNNFFLLSCIVFSIVSLYIHQNYRKNEFLSRIKLRKANDAIKTAYDQLEHFDKLKTNFFSNVSHEIRTPLTLIMGPLQDLLVEPLVQASSKIQRHLRIMLKNAATLHQLLSDLLDFSKLESGKASLNLEVMDLPAHIREIVSSFTLMADSKGITISFQSKCEIPLLKYDSYKIERVLYNLLSNAVKFTPSGGAVVVGLEKEGDDLKISVKDTGIGILPEEQEMIFDRFRQADEGSKRQHGGTGIGLSLVKEFTKLHGGVVRVDNGPGKGSVFTVSLPYNSLKTAEKRDERFDEKMSELHHKPQVIAPPALEQLTNAITFVDKKTQSAQTERAAGQTSAEQTSARLKILVIEDNSDMVDYIISIISPYFEVITSANGHDGYKAACDLKPDLILSDWMMPLKSGIEVCKEIKSNKETAHVPFVLLTSKAEMEAKIDALRSGADDYLTKPFDKIELLARIVNLLKNSVLEALLHKENIFLAYYDTLTKLPNHRLFSDRLIQTLAQAGRYKQQVAIAFLNLDRFKNINETLGYATGDLLLQAIAERLQNCLRKEDSLARRGGDEFLAMFLGTSKVQDISKIAQEILKNVSETHYPLNGHNVLLTASIGLSIYPTDSKDSEVLLKNADIAMNRAKEEGGNTFQFYRKDMNKQALEILELETNLRRALQNKEFLVYYQPKVDLNNGHITGTEALVRWKHRDWGLVSPSKFIPLAEDIGLVSDINEWVLYAACRQNKAWQAAGLPPIQVAVNLSSQQFTKQNLIDLSCRVLKETELDIKFLEFEVTESSAMQNIDTTSDILRKLKEKGVSISIDDFGTGYSSLSYLRTFPVHTVKIDQSFIRDMIREPESRSIVIAIVAMVHSLGLKVIAEGVEEEEQLAFLRSINCDAIQGYFFSRPLPAAELGNLLAEGKCL